MQAVSPTPPLREPPGELIDDDDLLAVAILLVANDVVTIPDKGDPCTEREFYSVVELEHADRLDDPGANRGPNQTATDTEQLG